MNSGPYIAFDGDRCLASGDLREVARAAKHALERRKDASILVFDDSSGPVEIDYRGTDRGRAGAFAGERQCGRAGRGRLAVDAARAWPSKTRRRGARGDAAAATLGVAGAQRGGASVALRRLVDDAARQQGRPRSQRPKKPPIVSSPPWAGTSRTSRKCHARCSQGTPAVRDLNGELARDMRDHVAKLAFSDRADAAPT